jgi:hypothetical protein
MLIIVLNIIKTLFKVTRADISFIRIRKLLTFKNEICNNKFSTLESGGNASKLWFISGNNT